MHRWHHTANVPEGRGYSVNYGVEFIFWDILFGTYYLPQENGQTVMPERIGHPEGLPDEKNYLKLLLMPLGLYPVGRLPRAPATALRRFLCESLRRNAPHAGAAGNFLRARGEAALRFPPLVKGEIRFVVRAKLCAMPQFV